MKTSDKCGIEEVKKLQEAMALEEMYHSLRNVVDAWDEAIKLVTTDKVERLQKQNEELIQEVASLRECVADHEEETARLQEYRHELLGKLSAERLRNAHLAVNLENYQWIVNNLGSLVDLVAERAGKE